MDYKKEMINQIQKIAGRYSTYEVFTDFIRMGALAIQNTCDHFHGKIWKEREQQYLDTVRKYNEEEVKVLCDLVGLLTFALEDNLEDVLGDVYMKADMGSKAAGQFFTPFHLSELTARTGIDISRLKNTGEVLELNEPSCGGGGMIIAACKVLKEEEINFQSRLRVVAQDLDWKGVYMTYLQLSLIGCNAIVVQGDTLMQPYDPARTDPEHIFRTPKNMGALL